MKTKNLISAALTFCLVFSLSACTKDGQARLFINDDNKIWHQSEENVYRINGNLGIGTDNPTEKLHIANGNIKIDNIASKKFQYLCTNTEGVVFSSEIPCTNYIEINYNNIKVDAVIDQPKSKEVDVLLVFHGTTMDNNKTLNASKAMLNKTKTIIQRKDIMIISVAYPEEGLFGDNIKEAEAALLWVKNMASSELGININKIYLFGHSQGGYLVTRLNTMHKTDGVIANGAGPIDLSFRCQLFEDGKLPSAKQQKKSDVCIDLKRRYGSSYQNPEAYIKRSMINFSSNYKSKILFIQGMEDGKVQMTLWPRFKEKVSQGLCNTNNCENYSFLEIKNAGHEAVFENNKARKSINDFIDSKFVKNTLGEN